MVEPRLQRRLMRFGGRGDLALDVTQEPAVSRERDCLLLNRRVGDHALEPSGTTAFMFAATAIVVDSSSSTPASPSA
ncbi:hypothetical protein [Burkholderia ubonensis]|uniref:hypothetical protein n=1 Tax=Burkholderia ubonensis TaxID=101571 RepID=UPI001160DAD7